VLVEPGLEPAGHMVHLGFLLWSGHLSEVADHNYSFVLGEDCCLQVVRDLLAPVVCSTQLPDLIAILSLALHGDVLHVNVRLHGNDLELETHEEAESSVGPGQAVVQVAVLVVSRHPDRAAVPQHDLVGHDALLVQAHLV